MYEVPEMKSSPAEKRQALLDIAAANGGSLEDHLVVTAASEPDHVLHHDFEWNDSAAARKFRLHQAQQLILRYKIIIEKQEPSGEVTSYRVDMFSNNEDGAGYSLTTDILSDPKRADVLLTRLKDRAKNLKHDIDTYRKVAGVIADSSDPWSVVSQAISTAVTTI